MTLVKLFQNHKLVMFMFMEIMNIDIVSLIVLCGLQIVLMVGELLF